MIIRQQYIEDLLSFKDKNIIKVITGIRRCGKSTLLQLFQNELLQSGISQEQIIFLNLEGAEARTIKNAEELYAQIEAKITNNSKHYVFIDEIQQVANFQQAVDWLYVKPNVDLYITGSNAFLLSGELATLLSGRYVEIKMQPLSFKEYRSAYPQETNLPLLYSSYLTRSSFPGALELSRSKDIRTYLEGIYNTILIKDILTRQKISEASSLISLIEFLFDNIGNPCSSNKIANTMTSFGRKITVPTVESYIKALQDSFVIYKASRYDVKGKQYLTSGGKYYIADIGLRYYLLGSKPADTSHILENVIYLELLRRGYDVYIGKIDNVEIDFIAINEAGKAYYQVSQTVMSPDTLKRELTPLEKIKDHNPKYLLTLDYLPPTSYNGIQQINALDWLLQ